MATISPTNPLADTTNDLSPNGDESVRLFQWANLTTNDVGAPIPFTQWADRTVQMTGTWGGATCVLEGSLDGINYFTLTDPQTTAISKTADALEAVTEITRFVRPKVTDGTAPSITVMLLVRRQQPIRV